MTPKFMENAEDAKAEEAEEHFSDPPFKIEKINRVEQIGAVPAEQGLPDPPPRSKIFDKERYFKVLKFWKKKERRCYEKKIVCKKRKKVADNKLRIQGKFVTIEQAIKLVGKRQVNKLLKEA